MVCDLCSKEEATVHLTEIIDNKITKLHLCENCARQKGAEMEQHFGIADLLAGLADMGATVETREESGLKCSQCGQSYTDFKKTGRLGCGQCYDSFRKHLVPLLKQIHGSEQHMGKTPMKSAKPKPQRQADVEALRRKLSRAIELEEFEEAARIRDEIRKQEKSP